MHRTIKILLLLIITFLSLPCLPCYIYNEEGIYWESENINLHNNVFLTLKILKTTDKSTFGYYLFDDDLKIVETKSLNEGKSLIYYDQYLVGLWAKIDDKIYYSMHEGFEKFKSKDDNNVLLFINSEDSNKVVIAIYTFDNEQRKKHPFWGLWVVMIAGFITLLYFEFKKNFKNNK